MQNHPFLMTRTLALAVSLAWPGFAAVAAPQTPAPAAKSAAAVPASNVVLNQKEIHAAYNEGDFEKVTALIDAFTRANKNHSRGDSIFIAKHLAVVYSANPQSREKGRYFMYRLLEMMPSAELVDMFVSDEIDRIFEKVRKEFLTRQQGFGVDSTQISMPEKAATGSQGTASNQPAAPHNSTAPSAPSAPVNHSEEYLAATKEEAQPVWRKNGFWIAGGIGLAVAGAAAYFIYTQDEPTGKTIVIPNGQASAQEP
ncbi:MAG: hypothetical protein ABIW76_03460 [Fibrobacteria bacterium]